jgi:GNAT superfamily N-acetyltransferase
LRASCSALEAVDRTAITRDVLGSLYDRAAALRAALRHYDTALDAALAEGPIEIDDGRMLELVETDHERLLASGVLAWATANGIHESGLDDLLGATKAGVERVVKARAPRGKGAALLREAMDALREAGAIETQTRRTKKVIRKNEV